MYLMLVDGGIVFAVEDSDDEAAEAGGTMKAKLQKGPLRVFPQGSSLRTTAYAIHV